MNGQTYAAAGHGPRRRLSYLVPPPPESQLPPYLALPVRNATTAKERRGNPNPWIILQQQEAQPWNSNASQLSSSSASSSSSFSRPNSTTHKLHHSSSQQQQPPQRHPQHTLGVSALVIDTSTILESSSASPSKSSLKRPAGILYSGGRDGLVAAWELGLPFRKRQHPHYYTNDGSSNRINGGGAGESGKKYRPRWSQDPYDSDEDDDEGDLRSDADDNDSNDLSVDRDASSSDEETSQARHNHNHRHGQQHYKPQQSRKTSNGLHLNVGKPSATASTPNGKDSETMLPYEDRWRLDTDALDDKIPPKSTFRQAHRGHTDWINDLVLCNLNQTVISASSDRMIRAWNPHDPHRSLLPAALGSHNDYVKTLAFCRDQGWVASGGLDKKIKVWDVMESREQNQPIVDLSVEASIYALATNSRGSLLACGTPDKVIKMYDPRAPNTGSGEGSPSSTAARLVGHADNVRSLIISKDGKHVLSGSSDATVKLWSVAMQRCIHTFTYHSDSIWSLHSNHEHLEVFYSGDRAGMLCKVDFQDAGDIATEGECVILGRNRDLDSSSAGSNGYSNSSHNLNEGITRIAAIDDGFVWTASGLSSIHRWKDIPNKSKRMAKSTSATPRRNSLADPNTAALSASFALQQQQQLQQRDAGARENQGLLSGSPSLGYNSAAYSGGPPLQRTASADKSSLSHSVAFAAHPAPNQRSSPAHSSPILTHRPSSLRTRQNSSALAQHQYTNAPYSSSPGANLPPILSSPAGSYEDPFNNPVSSPLLDSSSSSSPKLNGIPLESLVPLCTPDDPYVGTSIGYTLRGDSSAAGHGYSASLLSLHRIPSRPFASSSPFGGQQSSVTPPTSNLSAPRGPLQLAGSAGGGRTNSPLPNTAYLGYQRPSSIMEEEGDDYNVATPMEQKPSAAFILAKQDYEDRETALDGVPLRDGPDDVIRGRHGLVRSEMLNDKRTVITLDTYGDVAVWDIVLGGCIGRFRKSDLRQAYKSSMYINGNNDKKETDYENEQDTSMDLDDLLNFVRTTIEGEAVVASWCSVETKTGLLTVHVEQNRAFDAEVYIDEAGVPPKPEYRVDQRLNMGKWVIRNLFEGFIAAELKNQARGRTSSISSSTHSSVSASGAALQMRPTTSSSSSAGSSALGQRRPSHISIPDAAGAQASHFGQTPAVFSIALATPAMTPAVLPDVSDLAAQMASPRLFSSSLASTSTTQSNLPTIPQSPQGAGSVPSTPMSAVQREGDYFSFNRPKSSSSEAGPLGAVTPKPFSTIPSTPSAANLGPSAGASAPRASKMSRFKSFARRESRKESFTDPAPVQEEEKVLAPTAEEDAEAHLTPAEKAQQRLLRAIFSHPLQPSTASETPALPFVSNIPIMIGEESHDAGAWATVYRGLVSTAGQDAATLELNMPAWLLEFTLHNVIPQKDQPKIAFIMEPWGGPEKAGLPELPSGNARLSATRMLRMRKACHYIAEKLQLDSWKQREAYHNKLDAQQASNSTAPANGPAPLARSTTRTSLSSSNTSFSTPLSPNPNEHIPEPTLLPEDEVEILCNEQIVPLNITLAACAKYSYGKSGDIMLYYRRRHVVSPRLVDI